MDLPNRQESDAPVMSRRSPTRVGRLPAIAVSVVAAATGPTSAQWDSEPIDGSRSQGAARSRSLEDSSAPTAADSSIPALASAWRIERGELPLPVIEAAVVVREDHLAVLGGLDANFEATGAIQIHDPRRGWLPIGSQLAMPRAGAASISLPDGRVLLFGGFAGSISAPIHLEDGERLDPLVAGSSRAIPPFGESLEGLTATLLPGGQVLVAAGGTARIYDANLDLWSDATQLDVPRRHHVALPLDSSHVLLVGGELEASPSLGPRRVGATLIFVPSLDERTSIPVPQAEAFRLSGRTAPLHGLRDFAAARHPGDGRWLIAGGIDPHSGATLRETWWIDPDRAAIFPGPTMPLEAGACRLHVAPLDRGLAFIGGEWRRPGERGDANASLLLLASPSRETRWLRLATLPWSGSRRMVVDGGRGLELLGGYAFIDAERASAQSTAAGPRFDARRYRLSVAPLVSGD
jgi:hypothetical protein